jgi:hypothetical protein
MHAFNSPIPSRTPSVRAISNRYHGRDHQK